MDFSKLSPDEQRAVVDQTEDAAALIALHRKELPAPWRISLIEPKLTTDSAEGGEHACVRVHACRYGEDIRPGVHLDVELRFKLDQHLEAGGTLEGLPGLLCDILGDFNLLVRRRHLGTEITHD